VRAFLVSDNHDSLAGLRMAGIGGVVVSGAEDARAALRSSLEQKDLGILLVTEKVAAWVPEDVRRLRESGELPLVVEIPDRHGTSRGQDFLTRYVRDAIGVKME